MKNQLLFCAFASLMMACQQEADVQPSSATLASEVVGTYRTNVYLDPSCVAITTNQMPYVEAKAESANSVTLLYTNLYPAKSSLVIPHVLLYRQASGIEFRVADSSIGTLQTDRIFTDNGMEKQGKLLRISIPKDAQSKLIFTGSR